MNLEKYARLAFEGIEREYPYYLGHVFSEHQEIKSPKSLHPVFFGCFDWHSSVHGYWLLAKAISILKDDSFVESCRDVFRRNLVPEKISGEVLYLSRNPGFECPYGLAWLLTFSNELKASKDLEIQSFSDSLKPLEEIALKQIESWLSKLTYPVRTGTHNQTAFSMVLIHDWAISNNLEIKDLLEKKARVFFGDDSDYAIHLEPSGEDFLSPSLGSAWLMSRILDPGDFQAWTEKTIPSLGRGFCFDPVQPSDRSNGRLCHLDGLNLSRSWMLYEIGRKMKKEDSRFQSIMDSAKEHRSSGLKGLDSGFYAGSHWLGTFAAYLDFSIN